MAIPKIAVPHFRLTLPSNQKEITYRPFLVKEEKMLLMAREAADEESIMLATEDIIKSCVEDDIEIKELPFFDLEYLFLNIRAKSIGEEIELRYRHNGGKNRNGDECDASTPVVINVEDVEVKFNEDHSDKIMLTDTIGVKMKYPSTKDFAMIMRDAQNDTVTVIVDCIEYLFDDQQIYDDTTTTREEMIEFVENLNKEQLLKINEFFRTMPTLEHTVKYQCEKCGQEDEITLRGIVDFF